MTIGALVERERRHLRTTELAAGALIALGASALLVGLAAMSLAHARWLTLPRALPFVVWLVVAAVVFALGWRTRARLVRGGTRRDVALAIETEHGLRRGLLVGALELEGQGALAERAAHAARRSLPQGAPLAPALRRAGSRRALAGAAIGAAGVLLLAVTSPLFGDGLRAVLRPVDAWRGALLPPLRIVDAPQELVRGTPLAVTLSAPGRSRIFVSHRETGDAWRVDTIALPTGASGVRWRLGTLHGDVRLVVGDGRSTSDSATIHAVERPFVGAVTLRVEYPAYLSRAAETMAVGEPLRLPRGSVVAIAGRASVPLSTVALVDAAGERHPLAATGHTFAGRLVPTHTAQLRWVARGPAGDVTDVPPPLDIEVLADSAPRVAIAAPSADTILATEDQASLSITASDDHGIASILLRTTPVTAGGASGGTQPVAGAVGPSWSGTATLDVAALRLAPGEMVRVRAEAADASPWAQRGVSREIVVKRPSMEERRDVARALGDSAVKEARAAAAAQRSLAQRTDEAARAQARASSSRSDGSAGGTPEAGQKASMNFESAEKARGLAQEQRAMAERVQKLREATQQLERQLKAAGALDTALARQLGEAQAMLREALTPQMMAQMQKLEGAAQQMDGERSRDALRDLAQMQQRMKEQLEKSAEMLKRAAHEGAMQTLADQAKDLARQQRALADSAPARDAGATSRESEKLAAQTKRLREQMDDLKDRLAKDKAESGATRTAQAGEHAARSETEMRRAATEMQAGQQGESAKGGAAKGDAAKGDAAKGDEGERSSASGAQRARDAAGEMDQAARGMQEARAAQVKDWKKELTSELDQSVQEMMQLAREERALEQQARGGSGGTDQRGAQSAVEQGVAKASERLQGAAKKSALLSSRSQRAMSDAKDKVSQATQKLGQPSSGGAGQQAGALGEAADALTKAAAALARDRERANSAGSASGFSEMLQEMQQAAQNQGRINGQASTLLSMPGGTASDAGQSLARALARQQRGVADQLEDAGDAAGGERAAQLAREARQLADQLDGGRLDAATLARQQQLFRRLLDAGRSLEKEEREDNGKREAKTATGAETFTPTGKVDAKAATRFRPPTWEELRGLSADERRAILDYFARLNSASPR